LRKGDSFCWGSYAFDSWDSLEYGALGPFQSLELGESHAEFRNWGKVMQRLKNWGKSCRG